MKKLVTFLTVVALLVPSICLAESLYDIGNHLIWASAKGDIGLVKSLLKSGSDINAQGNLYRETALMWAARNKHSHIVKLLIDRGANVNILDRYHQTALMMESRNGHTDNVKSLLEHGANVDVADIDYDVTALMIAAIHGHTDIVKSLLKYGADVNKKDRIGNNAIVYAWAGRHFHIVSLLISKK